MRCQICEFENMEDVVRCFRCNTQLVVDSVENDFMPPRKKGRWSRQLYFRMRESWRNRSPHFFRAQHEADITSRHIHWMLFAIIPSLGHWLKGETFIAKLFLTGWTILLALTIYYIGIDNSWGGLLVGFHVISIFHAGELHRVLALKGRIVCMMMIWVLVMTGYLQINRLMNAYFYFMKAPQSIEGVVNRGETLLIQRESIDLANSVNKWVTFQSFVINEFDQHNYRIRLNFVGYGLGKIVAVPGQTVIISQNSIEVDGQAIPISHGAWLWPHAPLEFVVPEEHVFIPVAPQTNVKSYVRVVPERNIIALWKKSYVVASQNIMGTPLMIYHPIARRQFFKGASNGE